jgi:hypothetical protein
MGWPTTYASRRTLILNRERFGTSISRMVRRCAPFPPYGFGATVEPAIAIIRSAAARIDPRTRMVTMAFTLAERSEAEGNNGGALSIPV